MGDKEWALDLVNQFEARSGPGVWPHIDRGSLAQSLRDRLAAPDGLAQGYTNLCGVAAFVRDWLQDDPVGYVWLAINLYEKGVGNLSRKGVAGHVIRPSADVRNSVVAKLSNATLVSPADWIVMASLRDDLNTSLHYRADEGWLFFGDIRGLTSVAEVVKLFRRTGYTQVLDYANWWARRSAQHLEIAGRYVAANYKVVLFIDYRLLKTADQDHEALVATANHFVGLTTPVTFDAGRSNLNFKVFSYGTEQPVPQDGGWMPVKTLERHYYGFVAAKI
jgi:hypothetical protein